MKLPRLKPAAVQDGIEAAEYFTLQNPALGPAFKLALCRAWEDIARTPRRFAKLETNQTDRDIRRVILRRFNYLVIYEIKNAEPLVLAVMHASRQPDSWRRNESNE
jgi:plasmid stabilization system protein ParE